MISKFKNEILLFLIALIWLLFFAFIFQIKINLLLEGDEPGYLAAAKNLYLHLKVNDGRPLCISLINGFPILFLASDITIRKWVLIINILCWISTILLIYKIAKSKTNKNSAFINAIIFLLSIGNLAITFKFLSESIFIFMLVTSIYLINKYLQTKQHFYLTISLSLLILSVLVKPIAMGLVSIIIIYYLKQMPKIITNKYSVLVIISLFLLVFQMYSLKKEFGNFTVSYISAYTYYAYLGTRADCLKNHKEFVEVSNERCNYINQFSNFDQHKIANDDLKNQIMNNSVNLIKAFIINIYSNSSKGTAVIQGFKNYNHNVYYDYFRVIYKLISKAQNIIFSIFGIIISLYFLVSYKKRDVFFAIISIVILYIIAVSAISSNQGDRFHIVVFPLIILQLINIKWFKLRLFKVK